MLSAVSSRITDSGPTMTLEILVVHAKNLPNVERFGGKSDPFVIVSLQGITKKTKYIEGCLDPVWNERLVFELAGKLPSADETVQVQVKDYEKIGRNRLLGSCVISLRNLLSGPQEMDMDLTLVDKNNQPTAATLLLKVSYKTSEPKAGGGSPADAVALPQQTGGMPGVNLPPGSTAQLSTTVERHQIRVKVIEARQLLGSNLCPTCTVKTFQQTKHTKVAKATGSPFWNELFYFQLTASPADICDNVISFEVFHSKFARSNALIGSFACTLCTVYNQPSHALINKWLMLSDPNDLSSGITGYLKISVVILGPGDECPDFGVVTQSDADDVEGNLIWPAGVELRPATFSLDVFHGEDLPRMDSGVVQELKKVLHVGKVQKELVDPYLIFSFAGKEVQTRILYSSDHPSWKQKLNLGFMFPSMCNNIKLTIKDWDRLSEDDTIATASIPLPLISASGENGFLPTFGPCFVNLYGSLREFTTLGNESDDEMNAGKVEGCAYRGRVLVSIKSDLGKFPSMPTSLLEDADVWRTESYCRRRRFILNATFIDASMLHEVSQAVEFEVSIGNFGNKFENTTEPSPSSSQPTNAVFDGCQYHFLPWTEAKPCINIQCQWEDVTFRLETINVLSRTADTLEENLIKLKKDQECGKLKGDLAIEFIDMIDRLINDCSVDLPEPYPGQYPQNELDLLLKGLRQSELKRIVDEAKDLRQNAKNLNAAIQEVETYLATLKHLAEEPQNSIPDIIIWMICGNKRTAYYRIPAQHILYSPHTNANASGKFCGKLQSIILQYPGKTESVQIPVLLRLKLWFGLERYHSNWVKSDEVTELTVFAETYENQVNILRKWTNKGPLMTRPSFSDASGLIALPKEKFSAPIGWKFDGDWFLAPEPSMLFQADAGHKIFLEEVFENENRLPGGNWFPSPKQGHWTDVRGDPLTPRDEIECPQGWEWEDCWKYDVNRAVDEEGWEYTLEASLGGYTPTEKTYHLCRRRRWLRKRCLTEEIIPDNEILSHELVEGWEYAPIFTMSFHCTERKMDMVRRRRWHRKMIADDLGKNPVFNFQTDDIKDKEDGALLVAKTSPRMYKIFRETHKYQLRVYVYQARNLLAGDKTGFSDPFACISFLNRSQRTQKIKKTLCPTWDQSLIFEDLVLHGTAEEIQLQPPSIVIEIFDHDAYGEPDFLGRTMFEPDVHLNADTASPAKLLWYQIKRRKEVGGEILAAGELFLNENQDLPYLPPKSGDHYMVPTGVRPILQRTIVEMLCWGVRNLKTFELSSISNPSVELECGGEVRETSHIKSIKNNLNFETPLIVIEMMLPKEEMYLPPMNLKLRDHRSFGRVPIVGTHVIKSLHAYQHRVSPIDADLIELTDQQAIEDITVTIEEETETKSADQDEDIDWWSKYYASTGEFDKCTTYLEKGFETLEVFPTELEKNPQFKGFHDFLRTFSFTRGKSLEGEEAESIGELKGTLRVYPIPDDPRASTPPRVLVDLPSSAPEEIIIRLYIIKGKDLAPKDVNCLADPYVEVKIGKQKFTSRNRYKPNTLNPIFGEFCEMSALLPLQKDLKISVFDYDRFNKDDLIGETEIDLENRRFTNFRATCGLPKRYHVSGPNQWRDSKTPKEILEEICSKKSLPKPHFRDQTSVTIGSKTYTLQEFEKNLPHNHHLGAKRERLALHCLHAFNLVPEHVETRPLFNPAMPGLEQGKLELWIDIFVKSQGLPGPVVDITPRTATKYVVRCVIYNTTEVILDESNILGEKMSDIYVKGWISGINETQKTDVHYRSLDGEGNFNWRFVFPMDYLPAEQVVVIKQKEHFWSLDQTEIKVPPKLCLQIWDNDKFSMDDFLGELELSLVNLPSPAKSAKDCDLDQLDVLTTTSNNVHDLKLNPTTSKKINLFEKKRAYGFWPCVDNVNGEAKVTGKIEMEIEVLTEDEAKIRPAGLARDEPNMNPHLDPPNRPATSFLWFTSPWKSFRFILWKKFKWYMITFLVILILATFLVLFLYNVPYKWREAKRPREILDNVCRSQNLPIPRYNRGAFYIGKTKYTLQDFELKFLPIPYLGPVDERLALHILHTLPVVPEHVETRRLFNSSIPGMDQGKLELWVDIFPKSFGIPNSPVNILPRTPKKYELRCIIWNTKDVAMKDVSITGEAMSDIYVKGWIDGVVDIQKTDIHYRSMDGEGNFNWRFVFPLDYLAAEKLIIVNKKENFWEIDAREYNYHPKLCIQIWDNDMFASDDFIGYLELDLLNVPKPVKDESNCGLHQLKTKKKKKKNKWWKRKSSAKLKDLNENIDLFEKKHLYGFWPCIDDNYDQPILTGKIEMELELLLKEEAEEKPAGRGRDEPNVNPFLPHPTRPDIMVQRMLAPFKAFKVGVWDKIKWHLLTLILILLLIAFVLIGVYTFPQAVVDRIVMSF